MARAATTREAGGGDASLHAQRLDALRGSAIRLENLGPQHRRVQRGDGGVSTFASWRGAGAGPSVLHTLQAHDAQLANRVVGPVGHQPVTDHDDLVDATLRVTFLQIPGAE